MHIILQSDRLKLAVACQKQCQEQEESQTQGCATLIIETSVCLCHSELTAWSRAKANERAKVSESPYTMSSGAHQDKS